MREAKRKFDRHVAKAVETHNKNSSNILQTGNQPGEPLVPWTCGFQPFRFCRPTTVVAVCGGGNGFVHSTTCTAQYLSTARGLGTPALNNEGIKCAKEIAKKLNECFAFAFLRAKLGEILRKSIRWTELYYNGNKKRSARLHWQTELQHVMLTASIHAG